MKHLILVALIGMTFSGTAAAALISEFRPNPPGGDPGNQDFELSNGTAGAAFDLWVISVENDGYNGSLDRVNNIIGSFDANGIASVSIPDLENPSFTVILTDSFTGSAGDDIDAADNGTLDISSFGNILDVVGVADSSNDVAESYATTLGGSVMGPSPGATEPELLFRESTTGQFVGVYDNNPFAAFLTDGTEVALSNFTSDPTVATFGTSNPSFITAIPEPGSLLGLSTIAGGLILRRRRR
jgi:hypothetical protein